MAKITVTKVKSTIEKQERTKRTMKALGLNKIGDSNTIENNAAVAGMLKKVQVLPCFVHRIINLPLITRYVLEPGTPLKVNIDVYPSLFIFNTHIYGQLFDEPWGLKT